MTETSEALAAAVDHHRSGRLQDAEKIYRQVLEREPEQPDTMRLLGVLAHQVGNHRQAIDCISRAIKAKPNEAPFHCDLGIVHRAIGELDQATSAYRRALEINPHFANAHYNLGNVLRQQRRSDDAAACYRRALVIHPAHGQAANNLGTLLQEQGNLDEAADALREAVRICPDAAEVHCNLGTVLFESKRVDEAVACYRTALKLKPDYAEAHNGLGVALKDRGEIDEAAAHFLRAIQVKPWAGAYNNLGLAYYDMDRLDDAIAAYRRAEEMEPGSAEVQNNFGNALLAKERIDEAAARYGRAIEIAPHYAAAHDNLCEALRHAGRTEEVVAAMQKAQQIKPNIRRRFALATALPLIGRSVDELTRWRARMVDGLSAMIEEGVQLDPARDMVSTLFYLAYQGMNDRAIQQMVSQLYTEEDALLKPRRPTAPGRTGRIRVGFLSKFFTNHTIGKLSLGLIAHLSRRTFHVTVLSLGRSNHPDAREIQRQADRYVVVPENVAKARQIVADAELDVLFYTDVGMDPVTSLLARARLAPVQCVTWGHPVTTGIPTIDYFISSKLIEPAGAEEHYSERLEQLETLPVYFYRPTLSSPAKTRADFGLSDSSNIYLCPQSLFKFHPDFDRPLAEILRRDPRGEVVLIRGKSPHLNEMLIDRFRAGWPDVADRVRFLPRQNRHDFLHLVALADVVLDPLHFGGGSSTYEALSLGTPIVTWPSAFMRGRVTYACYRKMGMLDCVAKSADEYANLAVRLGTDREHRQQIRAKIRATADTLFEDEQAVRELERFFLRVVENGQTDPNPPLTDVLHTSTCPACGHHVAVSFYDGGERPLATLAWPTSAHDARSMPRYALSFVRCVDCGHVYNRDFDYAVVPYCDKPNLMFNRGTLWTAHLKHVRELILDYLPQRPTVVEIGSGDGSFLKSLARTRPAGRYIGFDPNAVPDATEGLIELRRSLFDPIAHLAECRPDLIVSRHVFEHLMNPLGFVQALSFAAGWLGIDTRLFIEVPCIDQAVKMGRTVDFFYEHNSNFTTTSLKRLLERCATGVELVERAYNDEVTYGIARFTKRPEQIALAREALTFRAKADRSRLAVRRALERLVEAGKTMAIWGGTGKAAAFIEQYGLDADRFATVVDSDPDKAGTFVPGTGQEIRFRDYLVDHPVEIIVIATQWRAADIVLEIERSKIPFQKILIEHEGLLIDYFRDRHPYR